MQGTYSNCVVLCFSAFIGQGADKNKEKGMDKKQQRAVLNGFTNGQYNVLVATCIGEEGLDIPEVSYC
jgi:ATP-dependent DNA helicase MPH1